MLIIRAEQMDALAKGSGAAEVVQPCPSRKTWVEVELVGEDDVPITGERYRLILPGGAILEGRLDANGLARVEGIDPGTCQVVFPDLDRTAWERIQR